MVSVLCLQHKEKVPFFHPFLPPFLLLTGNSRRGNVQVLDRAKHPQDPILLRVQGLPPKNDKLADVAAVVRVVEVKETVPHVDTAGLGVVYKRREGGVGGRNEIRWINWYARQRRTVPLSPPPSFLLSQPTQQRLEASTPEASNGMILLGAGTMNLMQPPAIVLQIFVVLGVNGLHFAGGGAFGEERGDEKLGETVQGTCGVVGGGGWKRNRGEKFV